MPENQPNWLKNLLYGLAAIGAVAATLTSPSIQALFEKILSEEEPQEEKFTQAQLQTKVILVRDGNTQ